MFLHQYYIHCAVKRQILFLPIKNMKLNDILYMLYNVNKKRYRFYKKM